MRERLGSLYDNYMMFGFGLIHGLKFASGYTDWLLKHLFNGVRRHLIVLVVTCLCLPLMTAQIQVDWLGRQPESERQATEGLGESPRIH